MSGSFGIVDLFAGPGGLGEGFSAFRDQSGKSPFSIGVSIEKEPAAHATLRLRSFLRKFGQEWPAEYYDFLNGKLAEEPDWSNLYPEQWAAAEDEARCMKLGEESTAEFLQSRITKLRREYEDRTVLIGGPPCQAYSLAGRSRNAGIAGYLPHKDDRNFLYQKYVDVLKELEPAAFVMENVKGMLSSSVKGDRIFHKVMTDLRSATGADSYRLLSLAPPDKKIGGTDLAPRDFVVNMEDHGIPQARHRVIIIGLRQDVFGNPGSDSSVRLPRSDLSVTVEDIIGLMPPLRSCLSRIDGPTIWRDTVLNAIRLVSKEARCLPKQHRRTFKAILSECDASLRNGPVPGRSSDVGADVPESCPNELREWILDPLLDRLPNHYARGHMSSDLARYLFVSAFGKATGRSPKAADFPTFLAPNHKNWRSGKFSDRFRVQVATSPASTVTSHISKDGHYFIHPDPSQCRSLTVREAARLQTFPDNYLFKGTRTQQYVQVGNAVPPFLALQIAECLWQLITATQPFRADLDIGPKLQAIDY